MAPPWIGQNNLALPPSPESHPWDNGAISRPQLHDELVARLRDFIIEGDLAEDEKIPEKELCERFGVSRTPLREALKVLAFEGLVVLNHNRGAVVKPLDIKDLSDAFPIYARLEALAGELACDRLTKDEINALRTLHDRMTQCVRNGDFQSAMILNEEFHARIQAASKNRHLLQLLRYVSSRVRRARQALNLPPARFDSGVVEHERIVGALEKGDAPVISGAIRDHVENTFRSIKDAWQKRQSSPGAKNASDPPGQPGHP